MKKLGFGQIIRTEKRQMNPIRRKINYTVVPILFGWFVASLIPAITLMMIDEDAYYIYSVSRSLGRGDPPPACPAPRDARDPQKGDGNRMREVRL